MFLRQGGFLDVLLYVIELAIEWVFEWAAAFEGACP